MNTSKLSRIGRGLICAVLAGALLSACVTAPRVRSSSDPKANFSQYQTFGFVSPLGTDRSGYQTLVSQQLKVSAQRELEARGLRYDETSPQLVVNFNAKLQDRLRVDPSPSFGMGLGYGYGGYYGYRGGLYSPWPLYREPVDVSSYTEGTLNIDVADAARKQLIWEAVVAGSVSNRTLENPETVLDAAVATAFKRFPVAPRTP